MRFSVPVSTTPSISSSTVFREALPFFVGVNLWEQSGAEEEAPTLSTMINAIGNVTEPLLEMSCLQALP